VYASITTGKVSTVLPVRRTNDFVCRAIPRTLRLERHIEEIATLIIICFPMLSQSNDPSRTPQMNADEVSLRRTYFELAII
jgi:hypothetical protein